MKKYLTENLSYIMALFALLNMLLAGAYQYVASRTTPLSTYGFIVIMPLTDYIENKEEILTVLAEREGVRIWQGKQTNEVVLAFNSFSMYAKGIKSFSPDSKTYSGQEYRYALWQKSLLVVFLLMLGTVCSQLLVIKFFPSPKQTPTHPYLLTLPGSLIY